GDQRALRVLPLCRQSAVARRGRPAARRGAGIRSVIRDSDHTVVRNRHDRGIALLEETARRSRAALLVSFPYGLDLQERAPVPGAVRCDHDDLWSLWR